MVEILMFHRVLNSSIIDAKDAYFLRGTLISTARLEQVITAYLNKGYNFKTVSELTNDTKQNQLVLTFDDGYFDNFEFAKPILDKYNIKATFYPIIGNCLEQKLAPLDYYYQYVNENVTDEHKMNWIIGDIKKEFIGLNIQKQWEFIQNIYHDITLQKVSYMTIDNLKTLQEEGHEIGGHSYYHDIYTNLSDELIEEDILKTKNTFFEQGITIKTYAYTDGKYNSATINLLKREGFEAACAIKSKKLNVNTSFELERKFVTEHDII